MFKGFEARDGFDSRKVEHWSHKKMMEAQHYIRLYNAYTARRDKFLLTKPRTKKEKDALRRFTSEVFPEGRHAQRAWIVQTEQPASAEVIYIPDRVQTGWRKLPKKKGKAGGYEPIYEKGLRVELQHKVRGGRLMDRDYIFKEVLGWQPGIDFTSKALLAADRLKLPRDPWEQMLTAIQLMLPLLPDQTPSGKEAFYKILTARLGPIGASVPKSGLMAEFIRYAETYGKSSTERARIRQGLSTFAETIVGVRFMGSQYQAGKKDAKEEVERMTTAQMKRRKRQAQMRKDYEKLSRSEHRARVKWARSKIRK